MKLTDKVYKKKKRNRKIKKETQIIVYILQLSYEKYPFINLKSKSWVLPPQ